MLLYLARHGETDANASGLVQGRGLNPPLNAAGRAQAAALAARLADVGLAAVFTSTQRRSIETAAPVLAGRPSVAGRPRAGLDEMHWGAHEGRGYTPDAGDAEMAAAYARLNVRWSAGETGVAPEGGESPDAVWARLRPVLDEMLAAGGAVLAVSHRRLSRILVAGLLPDAPGRPAGLARMLHFPLANAAVTLLDLPDGAAVPERGGLAGARIASANDASHLG